MGIGQQFRRSLGALALAAACVCAAAASAASLQYTTFNRAFLANAQDAMDDFLASHTVSNFRLETFEEFRAWDGSRGTTNPAKTKVGSFTTLGGHGTGYAAINDGRGLEVRGDNRMEWGRYNTDRGVIGGQWLDSNDTYGMRWEVAGKRKFNALAFFLVDAADVGGKFSIKAGDTLFSKIAGRKGQLPNGNIYLVHILLPKPVRTLTVELFHDRLNDGFGIDGAAIAKIAPIPLPAAGWLLVAGLAGLGVVARRRRAAA